LVIEISLNITTCKITSATEDSTQEYRKPEMTYLYVSQNEKKVTM